MPGIASNPGARIFERLVLKSLGGNSDEASVGEESLSVGRDEMREGPPLPCVAMEPKATVHGVDHSLAAEAEFAKRGLVRCVDRARTALVNRVAHGLTSTAAQRCAGAQLQAIAPSTVAGETAVTDP